MTDFENKVTQEQIDDARWDIMDVIKDYTSELADDPNSLLCSPELHYICTERFPNSVAVNFYEGDRVLTVSLRDAGERMMKIVYDYEAAFAYKRLNGSFEDCPFIISKEQFDQRFYAMVLNMARSTHRDNEGRELQVLYNV